MPREILNSDGAPRFVGVERVSGAATGPEGSPEPPFELELDRDRPDPELLALPAPSRRARTWTLALLMVTAIASLFMAISVALDARYAFASSTPTELGELAHVAEPSLEVNHLVRAEGTLGAAGAIRYERPFELDSFRVAPVIGRRDVWVEVRVPAGGENARYVPKSAFVGRLVRLNAAGLRHRGLAASLRAASGVTPGAERGAESGTGVARDAWLLIDGEMPGDARWAVALVVLFACFALWNVIAIARIVRPVA